MKHWRKFVADFAAWDVGAWLIVNVFFRIDRVLLVISRGRLYLALGWTMMLLTTTGRKSGKPRTIPLLYMPDGQDMVLIASNGGREKYPAWYWNLSAHPQAQVLLDGNEFTVRARQATGEEFTRLWEQVIRYYPGYAIYKERIQGRPIPLMVLTPQTAKDNTDDPAAHSKQTPRA